MGMNWKIVAGAVAVAVGLVLFAPGPVAAVAPLLIFAACPLSMLVMMRRMHGPAPRRDEQDTNVAEIARLRSEVEALRLHHVRDRDGRV